MDIDSGTRSALIRTVASLSVAAAALFLGLAVIAAGNRGGDDERVDAQVKGTTAEQPTVTAPLPPGSSASPGSPPVDPDAPAPVASDSEPRVARFEHGAFFTFREDPAENVAGSATVVVRNEGEVSITVSGFAEGDRAVIRATVENATGSTVVFPDGLSVRVDIEWDGRPWRGLQPSDRSVTELAPGETVSVSTEVALDGYGEYSLSGEVAYRVR